MKYSVYQVELSTGSLLIAYIDNNGFEVQVEFDKLSDAKKCRKDLIETYKIDPRDITILRIS